MTFAVPDFAIGNGRRYRLSTGDAAGRHSPWRCPASIALNARQRAGSLQPNDATRWRREWDAAQRLNFAIRDAVLPLADGASVDDLVAGEESLTHAQRRFMRAALGVLRDLVPTAAEAAGVDYRVADEVSVERAFGDLHGETTLFAHHLRSVDGSTHEVVRLRFKRLRPLRDDDHDWTAVAALVLAYARGVDPTARIRVSEFSLADGELRTLFDGTRTEAAAAYGVRGPIVPEALDGTVFRPGAACSSCAFLNVCPAVPRLRGALGLPGRAVATRHLTSADLHAYDRCPTAFLAQRRDFLPDGYAEDAEPELRLVARDRGIAVHTWLRWAHSREPARGCTGADLPEPGTKEGAAQASAAGLTPDGYRVAHPYLVQHVRECPLDLDGLTGWTTEQRVVVFDPDADMVVISTPDLTCEAGEDPIWRETKTAMALPPDTATALSMYPGFALNVALLAARSQAPGRTGHAELEVLTPDRSETFFVSTSDGATVAEAQRLVADIARRYAADLTFDRRPSAACQSCSAHRWCDPPTTVADILAGQPPVDDAEFGGYDDPF